MKTFINKSVYRNITKLNNNQVKMKFLRKTRTLGGSLVITIDKEISNLLNINAGDLLEIEITQKVRREDVPLVDFRCKKCEYKFAQNEEKPFCPSCSNEDLEVSEVLANQIEIKK